MKRSVEQCPVCESALRVTELTCPECRTRLQGEFAPAPLARLPREQQEFIETFVRCRGVIRDVERVLGISYPTVRARLDAAVAALEQVLSQPAPPVSVTKARRAILKQVEEGTLTVRDAAERLADL